MCRVITFCQPSRPVACHGAVAVSKQRHSKMRHEGESGIPPSGWGGGHLVPILYTQQSRSHPMEKGSKLQQGAPSLTHRPPTSPHLLYRWVLSRDLERKDRGRKGDSDSWAKNWLFSLGLTPCEF